MIHALLIILLYLTTPAPDCMFLDKAGSIVPAYLQQITDAIGTYHILSVPATATTLMCDGYKPVNLRQHRAVYTMQVLKTGNGNFRPVQPIPIGE